MPHLFVTDIVGLLRSVLAFLVVLGVLVFVHESGHYLAARWRGVHIETFSIGFGRPIASWTDKVGTVWKLAWLPLGGYVKLHGQERPETVSEEVRASWLSGRTFHEKSVGSRAIVVAAGPVANFLLAIVLFAILFATAGFPVATPEVAQVQPDSAAAKAGFLVGDRVETIGKHRIKRFEDIQAVVSANPGATLPFRLLRHGQEQTVDVTIGSRDVGRQKIGLLGIVGGNAELKRLGPISAICAGAEQTWNISGQTLAGLWQIVRGRRGAEDLGGPLRIAQLSGQVAKLGITNLLTFIGLLSINLGLINLFPIPILDGGHLVFYLLEALRGRPVPQRAQEYSYRAGFVLLACLFVFATWNDLKSLDVIHWVVQRIG